jgi:hypothetical protein
MSCFVVYHGLGLLRVPLDIWNLSSLNKDNTHLFTMSLMALVAYGAQPLLRDVHFDYDTLSFQMGPERPKTPDIYDYPAPKQRLAMQYQNSPAEHTEREDAK